MPPLVPRGRYFRTLLHGSEELIELHAGLTEGKSFYKAIITSLRSATEQATTISDQRKVERDSLLTASRFGGGRPGAPSPPPAMQPAPAQQRPPAPAYPGAGGAQPQASPRHGVGGNAQAYAAAGYPGGAAGAQQQAYAQPYAQPQGGYGGYQQQQQPAVARPMPPGGANYAQNYAQPYAQPHQQMRPQAVAQPMPQQQPAASQAPQKIACYGCRKHFGVPPNTAIVACPHCQMHNRVPGK